MRRILFLMLAFAALAQSALSAEPINTSTVTCKEYNLSSHKGMVDITAALYTATRENPKLAALSEDELGSMLDEVCRANPGAKVIDAVQ